MAFWPIILAHHLIKGKSVDKEFSTINARAGFQFLEHWEIALSVLNLFDEKHFELGEHPVNQLTEALVGRKFVSNIKTRFLTGNFLKFLINHLTG